MATLTTSVIGSTIELEQRPNKSSEVVRDYHSQLQSIASATTDIRHDATPANNAPETTTVTTSRAALIILQMSTINFLTSLSTGIIVVGLPRIAIDLSLPANLYLWPSSVYGLTAGSTLLLAGAIADVVGPRAVGLTGIFLTGLFTLCCGFTTTGIGLVICRALQGVSMAMELPCAVSIIAKHVPSGKRRNIGFSCLGLSMPLGFAVGLVLGGVLVSTVGWRTGFYIPGAIMIAQTFFAFRLIPADSSSRGVPILHRLRTEIDWVGATIACASLSMFSYVLADLSTDASHIRRPTSIALLTVSLILMPCFPLWMRRQAQHSQPALIPNSLWRNVPFTTMCILTILCWGVQNSMELFSNLYFQEVQRVSALSASLRLLPNLLVGTIMNLASGYFVDNAPVFWLVIGACILSTGGPLVMALIAPTASYWHGAFFAQILAPIAGDLLFTVGLIIVADSFPEKTQALAGAVYNTVAFFGLSLGLNSMQVVSLLVTRGTKYREKDSPEALLTGYRASFWAMTGGTLLCVVVAGLGLRKLGKVGMKRE